MLKGPIGPSRAPKDLKGPYGLAFRSSFSYLKSNLPLSTTTPPIAVGLAKFNQNGRGSQHRARPRALLTAQSTPPSAAQQWRRFAAVPPLLSHSSTPPRASAAAAASPPRASAVLQRARPPPVRLHSSAVLLFPGGHRILRRQPAKAPRSTLTDVMRSTARRHVYIYIYIYIYIYV